MANVGDKVRFTISDSNGRKFECEGIINGRITDRGGKKWLIKSWNVADPGEIGIRNIKEQ